MVLDICRVVCMACIAYVCGKLISKLKLPSILGWLIAGIIFGPYLFGVVSLGIMESIWYETVIKIFECFAGVMIGSEIIFKKIAKSGKQIIGITFIQSIGTFIFVSFAFLLVFLISDIPIYLSFVFGGIALATAPAPALSIVNEYKTNGPVTQTLLPLAAIDDVIGVIVFFSVLSLVSAMNGGSSTSPLTIIAMLIVPFVIGISMGSFSSICIKKGNDSFILFIAFLFISACIGLCIDRFIFHAFVLNYLLIGMAYSMTVANRVSEDKLELILQRFKPILNISLIIVIMNLGMPLDYRLMAGAGLFTFIYIVSRAIGKIGFAYIGGKLTKANPNVTKYLGFTLLPHSGVSLVFTGMATTTISSFAPDLANIVSGTIVAAAIINEVIAVLAAKQAFKMAGEI